MGTLKRLITEAHRRSLWQVLAIYAVASWIIWQVIGSLYEWIGLPSWVPGAALVLLLIGLPIVLATAFVQEGAPGLSGETGGDGGRDRVEGLETTAETVTAEPPTTDAAEAGMPEPSDEPGSRREPSTSNSISNSMFTWNKAITGGVLAFAVLGLAAAGFMGMRAMGIGPAATLISSGALNERDEIVLADFESLTGDTVRARVITEAFRAGLAQSTAIELATTNEVDYVLERMARPEAETLTAELARQVATRGGMKALVAGDIGRLGGRYVLSARLVGALDGDVLATFRETASDSTELVDAVDRLAKSLREKVGESLRSVRQSPYLIAITTPSLPALRKLIQAQEASNRGDEPRALALLEEAIELDPEFSEAHRKRGAIYFNRGRATEALAAFETALARPDRLTDYERYHTRAMVAQTRGRDAEAIAQYQTLLELDSTDTRALNNLGVAYSLMGDNARAADAYGRAVAILEADSTQAVFGGTYGGAATVLWDAGHRDSARAMVRRLQERQPGSPGPWLIRGEMAAAVGDYDEAIEHARAIMERFPANRDAPILGRLALSVAYAARGQVDRATATLREMAEQSRAAGELDAVLFSGVRAALLRASVSGDTAAAIEELAAARAAAPLDSVADPPLAGLAVAYAAAGQLDSARAMRDRLRARPGWFHRGDPERLPAAEAAIAQAEGDYAAALAGWRRAAAALDHCPSCFRARIGVAAELMGDRAAAMTAYESYLASEHLIRSGIMATRIWLPVFEGDFLHRGLVLQRLADLHEQAGNRGEAARYYREFVDLWSDADPELQPRVEAARRALARLAAEG